MALKPKFRIGEFVIDLEKVENSESLVKIISRRPVLENFKIDWSYFGYEYEVHGNPICLRYKTTIMGRESKFLPLQNRTYGP